MAAPTFVNAGTGATDAGGAWTYTCQASAAAGNVFIVQILQDGTGGTQVAATGGTNIEALDGTDNTWTLIVQGVAVGSSSEGGQYIFIGRALSTSAPTISGTNSGTDDLYIRSYQFTDVSTGTTLATVIENGTAGNAPSVSSTGVVVSDQGVQTLGVDRLACNFGAITDDASGIALFTGATGGTWAHFQSYETATGTDGTVFFEDAAMATAGTIDGGSATIVSLPWGVVGFALIGTTVVGGALAEPTETVLQAVNRASVW